MFFFVYATNLLLLLCIETTWRLLSYKESRIECFPKKAGVVCFFLFSCIYALRVSSFSTCNRLLFMNKSRLKDLKMNKQIHKRLFVLKNFLLFRFTLFILNNRTISFLSTSLNIIIWIFSYRRFVSSFLLYFMCVYHREITNSKGFFLRFFNHTQLLTSNCLNFS